MMPRFRPLQHICQKRPTTRRLSCGTRPMRRASITMKRRTSRARSPTAQRKKNLPKGVIMPLVLWRERRQPRPPRLQQLLEKMMSLLLKRKVMQLPPKTLLKMRKNLKVMIMIANTMRRDGTSGAKRAKTGSSTTGKIRSRMSGVSRLCPKH